MARPNIDLYNIGATPEELQSALILLRQEFDAHIHDGSSSKGFETIQAETLSARTIMIRKTGYNDSASGIWMGEDQNGTMLLKLGSGSSYLQWNGTTLSIVGTITATSGTIGGWTIGATTLTGGGVTLDSAGIITGGTIRTASSGERVQMLASSNSLQIVDSSNVVRAESFSNGWEFNNSVGTTAGRVFIEDTFGNLQVQAVTADLFLTSVSDITFAPGNGSISAYIDGTSKNFVMSSGNIVLGSTTIVGGGLWTLTLPSTDGNSGEFLQTNGSGTTTWAAVSAGANTALSNLASVAINTDLVSDSNLVDDLGSSTNYWDILYVGSVRLNTSVATIRYGTTVALDFFSDHVRLGSSYDDISPASALNGNLGGTFRWNTVFADTGDFNAIGMNGGDISSVDQVSGTSGNIDFSITGRVQVSTHFDPPDGGSFNTGGSTRYWGDVSYKTLTDRGCLGWYDEGVKLRDGRTVKDTEALKAIRMHPTKKTPKGRPRLDYESLPADVYIRATDHEGKELPRDEQDRPYVDEYNKKTGRIERFYAEDGAETTALISIMLGAIKELTDRVIELEGLIESKKESTPKRL